MCFNAQSSALAAAIGFLSAAVAFRLSRPVVGTFIAWYSLIQVAEFFIWRGLDTGSESLNRRGTNLAVSSLNLHAIVLIVIIFASKGGYLDRRPSRRLALQVILAVAFLLWVGSSLVSPPRTTRPTCSQGCRLDWYFGAGYPFQLLLMGAAVYAGVPEFFWPFLLFYGGTLVGAAGLSVVNSKTTFKSAVSSIWCFFSAVFAPILVGYLWWRQE